MGRCKIYVAEVNGRFHILKPGDKKCEKHALPILPQPWMARRQSRLNGSPAVANGRVYFCTSFETYCIGKKDDKTPADEIPPTQLKEQARPWLSFTSGSIPADVIRNWAKVSEN